MFKKLRARYRGWKRARSLPGQARAREALIRNNPHLRNIFEEQEKYKWQRDRFRRHRVAEAVRSSLSSSSRQSWSAVSSPATSTALLWPSAADNGRAAIHAALPAPTPLANFMGGPLWQ